MAPCTFAGLDFGLTVLQVAAGLRKGRHTHRSHTSAHTVCRVRVLSDVTILLDTSRDSSLSAAVVQASLTATHATATGVTHGQGAGV
jgi:hypothetical protein